MKVNAKIRPEEFNATLNRSATGYITSSNSSAERNFSNLPWMTNSTTGSKWNPIMTRLEFYEKPDILSPPVLVANLSKAVIKRDDTNFIIEVSVDI